MSRAMRSRIVAAAERACGELNTDLLVLPELTLSGYPPEDLLFHRGFRVAVEKGMDTLQAARGSCGVVRGLSRVRRHADLQLRRAHRSAAQVRATHRKSCLPNYKVFDEKRYFKAGAPAHGGRLPRLSRRHAGVRGHLGAGARADGALGGRRDVRGAQCLAVRDPQAAQPRGHRAPLRERAAACRWCT